jgi:hypothetical protein
MNILGCLINTRTYTLLRAKKFTANKRYKFLGPQQCICAVFMRQPNILHFILIQYLPEFEVFSGVFLTIKRITKKSYLIIY